MKLNDQQKNVVGCAVIALVVLFMFPPLKLGGLDCLLVIDSSRIDFARLVMLMVVVLAVGIACFLFATPSKKPDLREQLVQAMKPDTAITDRQATRVRID